MYYVVQFSLPPEKTKIRPGTWCASLVVALVRAALMSSVSDDANGSVRTASLHHGEVVIQTAHPEDLRPDEKKR